MLITTGDRFLASFDPGETTGWAVFGPKGEPLGFGSVKGRGELYTLLEEIGPVGKVVIEDYRLFGHKAKQQAGSQMEAVRVIGAIESWAHQHLATVTLQPASIKSIAVKFSGLAPKGAHRDSHHIDAYNHGYYWLQTHGIIKPVRRD